MPDWLKLTLGILLPALLSHAVWATLTILKLNQKVFGAHGEGNGLGGEVDKLKRTVNGDGGNLKSLEERARHGAAATMTPKHLELEALVDDLRIASAKQQGAETLVEALLKRVEVKRR